MPKFEKGHKFGGRPKGSKTRTYLNIEYWYNRLNAEWFNLKPAQRAKIAVELMKVLVNKSPALPNDPTESLKNTEAALSLIRALEIDKNNIKTNEGDTPIAIPPEQPRI